MRAAVLASAHYLRAVDADGLAPLGDALAALCRQRFRRIDRFVQLALLGSARCAAGHGLDPGCGIYMASTLGPVGSNATVQQTMLREHQWPMPFDFINTLGGSAGFYVARNLGLAGPNLFLGGPQALFDAFRTALTDVSAGAVEQALVGVVEQCPLPLAAQRARLRVADDTVLGEGSHWWLLGRAGDRSVTLQGREDGRWPPAALRQPAAVGRVGLACADMEVAQVHGQVEVTSDTRWPRHASPAAAWLGDACASAGHEPVTLVARGELLHIQGGRDRRAGAPISAPHAGV